MTSRARLVAATGNAGKVRELRALLGVQPVELLALSDPALADRAPVRFPPEGDDYRANALAKALAVAQQWSLAAIADDSGLEVDALGGAPGPYSARYGGSALDDAGRVAHLLAALRDVPPERRGARFVCWTALAIPTPGGEPTTATAVGTCAGWIRSQPSGGGGFGYDPVFVPQPTAHARGAPAPDAPTMAELAASEKNAISHRARAVAALVQTRIWESWVSR